MLPDLRRGIYELLISAIGANNCGVYFVEAPADQALPYVVFSQVTGTVRWDTMNKDEEQYVQINGYGKDLEALSVIKEAIRERLDNKPEEIGTRGSYTVYDISEQLNRVAKLGDVWQFTLQFKITIQKS